MIVLAEKIRDGVAERIVVRPTGSRRGGFGHELVLERGGISWAVNSVEVSPDALVFWSGGGGFPLYLGKEEQWRGEGEFLVGVSRDGSVVRVNRALFAVHMTVRAFANRLVVTLDAEALLSAVLGILARGGGSEGLR